MILNNKEITITRFTKTNGKSSYTDIIGSTIWAYIQPLSEDVIVWEDWIGSYDWYLLMCSYTDVQVWDKIEDWEYKYKVKWVKKFDTIIDIHIEAIIQKEYAN